VLVVRRVRFFGMCLGPCTSLNRSDVRGAPLHRECIIGKFKNACALPPPPCLSTWRAVQCSFIGCVWIMYVRRVLLLRFARVAFFISSVADNECKSEELHLNASARRVHTTVQFIACDSYAITNSRHHHIIMYKHYFLFLRSHVHFYLYYNNE